MNNLDATLNQLDPERECLLASSGPITVRELRASAARLRDLIPSVRGSRLALCGLSSVKLIEAIIALDGVVTAILLLPAGLDHDVQQSLVDNAQCDYVLDENGRITQMKADISPVDHLDSPTRWMLATSGTTGEPKVISHTLMSLTRKMKRDVNRGMTYTWGLMYDPCRFAGLQVVLQALVGGSRLATPLSASFEEQVTSLLEQNVNALSATPSLWRKLLMDGRILGLPLKQITLGGEIADQPLLDGLIRRFPGARIVHIYASTETGTAFAVQDGCAGFPAQWLENSSAPVPLRISNESHLLIKPAEMPEGEEILSRLDADGYLDTQDLVRQDADRVFFLGRASGAINVGGNKVHPEEIENLIREIPDVLDVRVFGKASSMMGQLVSADVVAAAGVDANLLRQQIRQQCRDKLEQWQCPALVKVVAQLHETAAGKRQRIS